MKWLLAFAAVHGVSFSDSQCRVLRQVELAPAECTRHFASQRSLAASFSGRTPGAPTSAPGASASGGPSGSLSGGPSGGLGGSPGSSGSPGSPRSPRSGAGNGSPGAGSGSPGNPGGGGSSPGGGNGSLGGTPIEPDTKPPDGNRLAALQKLRGELRDAARQRAIDRIIFGAKPPDSQPGKPDRPGKPGFNPGPGGLRGASSKPASSGGIRR